MFEDEGEEFVELAVYEVVYGDVWEFDWVDVGDAVDVYHDVDDEDASCEELSCSLPCCLDVVWAVVGDDEEDFLATFGHGHAGAGDGEHGGVRVAVVCFERVEGACWGGATEVEDGL